MALLAIEGERSAYDLLRFVRKAIGYVWAPAKTQLYATLPRLAKDGLAQSRAVTQADNPDKTLYRISAVGRAALRTWHETVVPGSTAEFELRLFVGALPTDEVLIEHVEQFRRDSEERLAEYRAIEPTNTRTGNDFYHYFLLRLGIERAEHLLDWAGRVEAELRAK